MTDVNTLPECLEYCADLDEKLKSGFLSYRKYNSTKSLQVNAWTKHFDRDLSRGESHEHIVLQYLQKFYPSAYKIDGYFKGYDIFIPEIESGIEVKYDYASNRTGNILIELEFPVGTPSALRTTEAVWWFITDGKDYFSIRPSNIENFAIKNNIKAIQKRGDGDAEPKLVWLLPKKKFLKACTKIKIPKDTFNGDYSHRQDHKG